jgi:thioester reductase-like protein
VPSGLIFLTGFPGFIGRRVVGALLERNPDARVAALVEPKQADAAAAAAASIDTSRIEILPGDISERGLGLEPAAVDRLRSEITQAYHLAAIYNLAVPLDLAERVNVAGTGNVVELCASCNRLERLHYVSTAYVAGDRSGVVYEHELVCGQGFKNHYESTKFQAELWVREWMDRVPTTIYRPAIVVGDSRSGETQKFDGPYYMLRVVSRSVRQRSPIPQFGASDAPFNVVPVDFVVDALLAAADEERTAGETLHLVDPDPVTAKDVLTQLAREYAGREPSLRIPPSLVETSMRLPAVRAAFGGAPRESIRYLNHSVRFDTRRAEELLPPRCPRFEEYVGPVVRFFREHEDDPQFAPAD